MKFLCIIVVVNFILKEVEVFSVAPSVGNETLKISSVLSPEIANETSNISSTSPTESANETLNEDSSLAPPKRFMNSWGIMLSNGILELLEGRLEADKLEYAEETLLKIYQILNMSLPTCDHPAGSKEALLLQLAGIRNKTKELETYEALISIKQLLHLMEDALLYYLGLLDPKTSIIKDGLENATDSIHYLRWKRFFKELPNHPEIKKLGCIFGQNISEIDDFCRHVDKIFSYTYGGIESASTGLLIQAMTKCKTVLLRDGETYASEIKVIDALIRLQSKDRELYALFNAFTEDPHDRIGKSKRPKLFQ